MSKKYKYYFKVLNHPIFGGDGTEGYISLGFTAKEDNPVGIARSGLGFDITSNVNYIEISEEEYLEYTEEDDEE